MFCDLCGANNPEGSKVCTQCGRNFQPTPETSIQPPMPMGMTPSVHVPNYLVFAILTTVLCCLPAGIPAIVYAAQVNGKLLAGDIAGAQLASKNAKMWCWVAFGAGLAVLVLYMLVVGLGVMSNMTRH